MAAISHILTQFLFCSLTYALYDGFIDNSTDDPIQEKKLSEVNDSLMTAMNLNAVNDSPKPAVPLSDDKMAITLNEVTSTKISHKTRGGHGTRHKKNCCKNGGRCILSSFCQCSKEFHGRYCELKVRENPCGPIPHGAWIRSDCDLCYCYNGSFDCLQRIYPGCDESEPLDLSKKINPLKGSDIEILSTDTHIEGLSIDTNENYDIDEYYDTEINSGAQCYSWPVLVYVVSVLAYSVFR